MINIYAEHITNRLIYVLDFCFKEKKQTYQIITNHLEWKNLENKDINYSNQDLPCKLQIAPQGILFESDIYPSKKIDSPPNNSPYYELKMDGVFDSFGLIFYFLTNYDSYFSVKKDNHDRVISANTTLVKHKLNKKAIVDQIVKSIWEKIELDYTPVLDGFNIIPTFDIDIAWAYKNRPFPRAVGAFLKGKKPIERLQVLGGAKKDPYDTYAIIYKTAKKLEETICFTLLGDWGKYDKNIHWENENYQTLIQKLNSKLTVGIHPSYASYLSLSKVQEEINRLETITDKKITRSRQHFLRLKIPETYNLLLKTGVTDDYSMGYADNIGFRAGTSFSFYFFDLLTNKKTNLEIHPFAYMDSALKDYLKLSANEAIETIDDLMDEVQSVGGKFIFIWHNSSIHNKDEWKGWKAVLDHTVNKINKI